MSDITVVASTENSSKIDGLPTSSSAIPITLTPVIPVPPETVAAMNEDVVPPSHPSRTPVLCFDGTGDQFDSDVSLSHTLTFLMSIGNSTQSVRRRHTSSRSWSLSLTYWSPHISLSPEVPWAWTLLDNVDAYFGYPLNFICAFLFLLISFSCCRPVLNFDCYPILTAI